MREVSYTEFRKNLSSIMEEVEANKMAYRIKRRNYPNMVLITEQEYNSLVETLYLLSTPANAAALYESIRQAKKGEVEEYNFDD